MAILTPGIRNAARALIIRDERLLLLRKDGGDRGERYALPGGAQEHGETLQDALERECLEEIGVKVMVRDLLHVADWFKPRDTVPPSTRQLVEFLFACDVPGSYEARNGHRPDKHQVDVVWIDLEQLSNVQLFPRSLSTYLTNCPNSRHGVYLGTMI
jgi:ADP-ribose pyrophosphatase YjhB (NUDIX family)